MDKQATDALASHSSSDTSLQSRPSEDETQSTSRKRSMHDIGETDLGTVPLFGTSTSIDQTELGSVSLLPGLRLTQSMDPRMSTQSTSIDPRMSSVDFSGCRPIIPFLEQADHIYNHMKYHIYTTYSYHIFLPHIPHMLLALL